MRNKQIAFIASTLPVQFIYKNRNELNIEEIIIVSKTFEESYMFLQDKMPLVKLSIVPTYLIFQVCYLAYKIIFVRLAAKEIIFFHECCWPIFDLLVKFIKPRGLYCPQVKMTSFSPVMEDEQKQLCGFKEIFSTWLLKKYFILYKAKKDGGEGYDYFWSMRNYPLSIIISNEYYSFVVKDKKTLDKINKKILFLIGREPVQDDSLCFIFNSLCIIAKSHGFAIAIKDHPRPAARINFKPDGCRIINPAQPVELLEEDFEFVVGVASTGLLAFPGKAISVINLLAEMSQEDKEKRISHLQNLPGWDRLIFLNKIEEFESILFCQC